MGSEVLASLWFSQKQLPLKCQLARKSLHFAAAGRVTGQPRTRALPAPFLSSRAPTHTDRPPPTMCLDSPSDSHLRFSWGREEVERQSGVCVSLDTRALRTRGPMPRTPVPSASEPTPPSPARLVPSSWSGLKRMAEQSQDCGHRFSTPYVSWAGHSRSLVL